MIQWLIELRQVRQKHQQLAQCESSGRDLSGSKRHNPGGAGGQDGGHCGEVHDLGTMLVSAGLEGFRGLLVEGGCQRGFSREGLDEGQVGHRLLDGGRNSRIGRLGLCGRSLELRTEDPHHDEQGRYGGQRYGGQG